MARFRKRAFFFGTILAFVFPAIVFSQENKEPYVEKEMMVKLKFSDYQTEENILKIVADQIRFHQFSNKLETEKKVQILNTYAWANIYHVRISKGDDLKEKMEEIRRMSEVEYVEHNYFLYLGAMTQVVDVGPDETLSDQPQSSKRVSITAACRDVVVAMIDTGIDYTHPDLAAHIWKNPTEISGNGIDDDNNGYVDDTMGWDFVNGDNDPYDDHYHGTHVSGIVLGFQDPIRPIIKIMPLKFLSHMGFGSTGDAIRAIDYAVKNGAKVLNNSWGGGNFSQALRDAIISSYYANRIFVVAAGNNAVNIDQFVSYPPSYLVPNIISVAALDHLSNLAWFSNWGPRAVHIGAPGVSIRSSVPKEQCETSPCYGYLSGTSMAAPYVSGVTALMLCENPDLMHLQVKNILMETSVSNASLEGKIGKGSISGENAIVVAATTSADTGEIPIFTPSNIPSAIALKSDDGELSIATMGCGTLLDDTLDDSDDGFGPSSSASLVFLFFPFLFILMMKTFLRRQRKFFLNPF